MSHTGCTAARGKSSARPKTFRLLWCMIFGRAMAFRARMDAFRNKQSLA
jgi:hypothetical protein